MAKHIETLDLSFLAETAPVCSLPDVLALRSLSNLRQLAKGLHIPNTSKLRKAGLIQVVIEALEIPERLEELLYILEKPSWDFFCTLAAEGPLHFGERQSTGRCRLLEALGYIQPFLWDEQYIYVLPDEIKTLFRSLADNGFPAQKKQADLIHDCATAAVHLYGVIQQDDFFSLLRTQTSLKLSPDEIFQVLFRHIAIQDGYCLWKDYLLDDRFEENNFDDVADLLEQTRSRPRYVPAPKEFLCYADWRYYEPTVYTQNLLRFLMREARQPAPVAVGAVSEIVNSAMMNGGVPLMVGILDDYGVDLTDEQFDSLMKLLVDVSSHTRTWANNGHTSAEIASMSRSAAHCSEGHKKKPGRNDPCPCGSGLKYKKCCGR